MTKNFSKGEFDCKCGCTMPQEVEYNIVKLANQLQAIRDYVKTPIDINSAYRCKSHNQAVNGSNSSQHLLGKASDIVIRGYDPSLETHPLIEELINEGQILQGGLGDYSTFTHYDIRKTKARW
jgi:uncharacterized protein YcbK (DUF882 family)